MLLTAQFDVLTEPYTSNQVLACHDMPQSCRDGGRQQQMLLDRAAADSWGLPEIGRPRLHTGGTDHTPTRHQERQ